MSDAKWLPEVDPNPAEPRMVIWSTLRCLELQIDQHEELYNSHGVVSWELLKHMVRLAKRHAHEEGGKIGAAERETDQWRTPADEANAKLRETEQELGRLRQRHVEVQSEEVAAARAEIETLRKELADAKRDASDEFTERQVLTVEQQQDAAAWQQQVDSANAELSYLRARLDEERSVSAGVREKLTAAEAAVTLQRARIERQRRVVDKVRQMLFKPNRDIEYGDINGLRAAIAELDAQPSPVAETAEGGK